tara:strand:+ start:4572 stop:5066 length:495 start_codon:yes stop_codon:yes gene_type:complete
MGQWETVMVKVLFICLGNICRSPTAEGVFRSIVKDAGLSDEIKIDSVGTGSWHVGDPPDRRSQEAAARRGIDISHQRSRQISQDDIAEFDYLVVMDRSNIDNLDHLVPTNMMQKIYLFLEFAPRLNHSDVPDPYYGGPTGFDVVLDLIEEASKELLAHIRKIDL